MTNITTANIEWDSLLIPEDASSEEKEKQAALIAEYLSQSNHDFSVNQSSIDEVIEIDVDNSLFESTELDFEKISNQELFNYFRNENKDTHPDVLFPKTDNIHAVFWFLHHLGQEDIKHKKITVGNPEDVSVVFYLVVEAASFFGYFDRFVEEDRFYFMPTEQYEKFMEKPLEEQYHQFLASLGRNEAISEALQVQLNDPIYDNISRQMVHNILVKDPSIKNEELSNDEVKKIANDLRYWYLAIKQAILEN